MYVCLVAKVVCIVLFSLISLNLISSDMLISAKVGAFDIAFKRIQNLGINEAS